MPHRDLQPLTRILIGLAFLAGVGLGCKGEHLAEMILTPAAHAADCSRG